MGVQLTDECVPRCQEDADCLEEAGQGLTARGLRGPTRVTQAASKFAALAMAQRGVQVPGGGPMRTAFITYPRLLEIDLSQHRQISDMPFFSSDVIISPELIT